jgi:predicted phage-related endonuclease
MKMIERKILSVVQGSAEWLAVRAIHCTASEAPAALGVSKYTSRTELLHQKSTGISKEVDAFTQGLFDQGHETEALARVMAEEIIGTDLYPITATARVDGLDLLSSLDGETMDEEIIWEHKLFNAELADAVRSGNLDPHYTVQMDQQLLVSGAKKCLFMTSDGTPENVAWCWYESSQDRFDTLIAGWKQFAKDLADYVPVAIEAKPVGRTPETLPALRLEVTGMVTASNLGDFKEHALAVFAGINRELTTDQHFADAEKTVKWCGEVESRLAAAKEHALSQTQSIDALFKTIDDISAEARTVRLELDKLVTKRKVEIKESIIIKARNAYGDHVDALKVETEGALVVMVQPDFAGAAKGKRTVASIQDAVDTVLANAKIEADASAKRIRANLACIKSEAAEYEFLFADKSALIVKPLDDLKMLIKVRITEHKAAEEKRLEAQREQIRQEEQAKAAAKIPAPAPIPPAPIPAKQEQIAPWIAPVQTAPSGAPTLRLGQINERLAPIALSADGLASLGFAHAATDKAAKLYHEAIFPQICAALIRHIEAASGDQAVFRQQAA